MSPFPSFSFNVYTNTGAIVTVCVYVRLPVPTRRFVTFFSNLKSGFLFLGVYDEEVLNTSQKKWKNLIFQFRHHSKY